MKRKTEHAFIFMTAIVMLILLSGFLWFQGETDHGSQEHAVDKRGAPFTEVTPLKISRLKNATPRFDMEWIRALPSPPKLSEQEMCLAEALYFEARGEPVQGQIAVAEVILNRARSARFPDTICDVIYQGSHRRNACQFSYACDGAPERFDERDAYDRAQRLAAHLFNAGRAGLARGAEFYHAVTVQPSWAKKLHQVARIGDHVFLRHPESRAADARGRE
ncbi:cell wall hydrolase [Roseovarius sp. SYSU LYC5161]|uniref:cell wall hydrolase n=1 Tax=Roseovarius halophilus (ex Wu et al. 2025) TaxID=3376060 RepID=UPI0028718C04|nr:cell wall hydrolase [Roseovarius sp.]